MEQPQKTPTVIESGAPMMEGRDGYFLNYLRAREQVGIYITQAQRFDHTDPRIEVMARFLISGITDKAERDKLLTSLETEFKAQLQKFKEEQKHDADNQDRAKLRNNACLLVLGEVSTWYDNFVGITMKNAWEMV